MAQQAAEILVVILMGFMVLCLFAMFAAAVWDKVQYERRRMRQINPPKVRQIGVIIEPEPKTYPLAKSHVQQD